LNQTSNKNKIWIDLDNSPHVLFFSPLIKEFEKRGHEVFVTARDYAQVIKLADLFELKYKKVGRHYGKNKWAKALGLFIRALQLIPYVLKFKPQLGMSHGSRAQVICAKILGIKTVLVFDYEFAKGLPIFKPTYGLVPEVIYDRVNKRNKIVLTYPGIKEYVYIGDFKPDHNEIKELGLTPDNLIVTVRPPASVAHYHHEKSDELFDSVMNLLGSVEGVKVIILPRIKEQGEQIKQKWNKEFANGSFIIPDKVFNGLNLIWFSDLALSGGGTMIREAAALDVPAYSFFGGKTGAVDEYLEKSGKLTILRSIYDVKDKLKLQKRSKDNFSNYKQKETLNCVVDTVEKILYEENPSVDKALNTIL